MTLRRVVAEALACHHVHDHRPAEPLGLGEFLLDGRAVAGRSGNAGHIGQIHVADADPEEGSDGTLESIASGPSSVAWARRRGFAGATGEDLARAVAAGDPVALAAVARSAAAVGPAIADVATLLDVRDFAWTQLLREHWRDIRDEAVAVALRGEDITLVPLGDAVENLKRVPERRIRTARSMFG